MRYTLAMELPVPGTRVRVARAALLRATYGAYVGQVGVVETVAGWHVWKCRMPDGRLRSWWPLEELAPLPADDDNAVDP